MTYSVTKNGKQTLVHLTGEIDLERSPEARKTLLGALDNSNEVIVDMADVDYIDSSGVASLVEALQSSKKKKIQFTLKNVSEPAMKVFKLARLEKVFKIL